MPGEFWISLVVLKMSTVVSIFVSLGTAIAVYITNVSVFSGVLSGACLFGAIFCFRAIHHGSISQMIKNIGRKKNFKT